MRSSDTAASSYQKYHGSIVVEANWDNNPWFPAELRAEKDFDYRRDPDKADETGKTGAAAATGAGAIGAEMVSAEFPFGYGWSSGLAEPWSWARESRAAKGSLS